MRAPPGRRTTQPTFTKFGTPLPTPLATPGSHPRDTRDETPPSVCGYGDGARWNGHAARNFFGGLLGGGVLVGGRECAGRRAGRGAVCGDFLICACILRAPIRKSRKKASTQLA